MKTIFAFLIFIMAVITPYAEEWETYQTIDRLLAISKPAEPIILEDSVIFTAASDLRKVGIAFAHEDFSKIYWFRQLLISQDQLEALIPAGRKTPELYKDSGIMFHIQKIPENCPEFEYRLIINGLWTIDPINTKYRKNPVSGFLCSVLDLPRIKNSPDPLRGLPDGLMFSFDGPPGETVSVAGNFNGWDPFMYELKEGPQGVYTITIPLPPGIYQYVFFNRGKRYTDPYNPRRIYSRDGSAASEIVVP
jgi:hypothetical protein